MIAPDLDAIEALALAARDAFPAPFRAAAAEVRIVVAECPPEDVLDELQIADAYDLTGLYDGVPITERSVEAPEPASVITLYRRPILDEWAARGDVTLEALVTNVMVHEFAHHFGWSDDDVARIDRWWE